MVLSGICMDHTNLTWTFVADSYKCSAVLRTDLWPFVQHILALHAPIQEFSSGEGGGGPAGQSDKENYQFTKVTEGGPTFSRGGGPTFSRGGGGPIAYSLSKHITCDFQGGPDPYSPLWICAFVLIAYRQMGGSSQTEQLHKLKIHC